VIRTYLADRLGEAMEFLRFLHSRVDQYLRR